MKFTPEEISLCKQVAEKYRKPIIFGTWYQEGNDVLLHNNRNIGELYEVYGETINPLPLWTISDCLEFLRTNPRIQIVEIVWDITKFKAYVSIRPCGSHHGETILEACLKAVLAVLEEKK